MSHKLYLISMKNTQSIYGYSSNRFSYLTAYPATRRYCCNIYINSYFGKIASIRTYGRLKSTLWDKSKIIRNMEAFDASWLDF